MANKVPSDIVLPSDVDPGQAGNPGVTQTTTVRRTVTRVSEVITDVSFSEDAKVSAPLVLQASNGVLDFRTFDGDITVLIKKWTFMAVGCKAWLVVKGKLGSGKSHTIQVMAGKTITPSDIENGVSCTLSRTAVEKFPDFAELLFIFTTTLDECSEDGAKIVFPEKKLILHKVFRDLENFSHQNLGLWTAGTPTADSRELTIEYLESGPNGKPGHFLKHYTYAGFSAGPILQREFKNLIKGKRYKFSVDVRRYSVQHNEPQLSLSLDGVDKTPVLKLLSVKWQVLGFTFVAGDGPTLLSLYNHQPSVDGNDWYTGNLLVESVPDSP